VLEERERERNDQRSVIRSSLLLQNLEEGKILNKAEFTVDGPPNYETGTYSK
jgi:hypothetical protein